LPLAQDVGKAKQAVMQISTKSFMFQVFVTDKNYAVLLGLQSVLKGTVRFSYFTDGRRIWFAAAPSHQVQVQDVA
jgi:hypothetical protein